MPEPSQCRCGIDTVDVARVERLLRETPEEDLRKIFAAEELAEAGQGPGRVASLAARFAAKEACLKLFPRETALGAIGPADFVVRRDGYGAPRVQVSPAAQAVLDRARLAGISLSLTHSATSASAIALGEPARLEVPWYGRLIYHLLPVRRRVVLGNLRRVFGDTIPEAEIRRLAQAFYAHFARLIGEFLRFPWLSASRRAALVRVENIEAALRAHARGKGALILTGHFGNWEITTVAGITQFPQYRGLFHFLRRPLQPAWFDDLVTRRFRRAGLGTLPKRGALDAILDRLSAGGVIVFVFDQHAGRKDGIPVEFFGRPAGTFRSLAILALATGAPVVPATAWREPDGTHVLRFEEALPLIECADTNEAIRRNTRAYNAMLERLLLRHPEQWFWMHRRWKLKDQ
ncbi:MAG: 4'-phosphopantetheinyl transferase superfamily protein [candidate division NC10 bacterium]|nr:4'-phosphopantetheinyl transferase superfamily protein [candidate division NC10 bacterium]